MSHNVRFAEEVSCWGSLVTWSKGMGKAKQWAHRRIRTTRYWTAMTLRLIKLLRALMYVVWVSICHFVRRLYLICHSGPSPATLLLRNQRFGVVSEPSVWCIASSLLWLLKCLESWCRYQLVPQDKVLVDEERKVWYINIFDKRGKPSSGNTSQDTQTHQQKVRDKAN